jgi:hypothetical protein
LVVKGGSKEEGLLLTIAGQERATHSTLAVSTTVTAEDGTTTTTSTPGKEANIKELLDDPVREKVNAVLKRLQEEGPSRKTSDNQESDQVQAYEAPIEPYTLKGKYDYSSYCKLSIDATAYHNHNAYFNILYLCIYTIIRG